MTNTGFMLSMDMGERLRESGFVTLQGMVTIFLVLTLLLLAVEIMHIIIHCRSGKAKKESKKALQNTPNANDAALAAAIAAAIAANEDDGSVVAAITAAISAMRAEEGECGEFRVVAFRRVTPNRRKF